MYILNLNTILSDAALEKIIFLKTDK
jgi:hypothetical protein